MPKISIIIPTFNSQEVIKKCLEGVKSSTFQDYEIIVIDCDSSDRTCEIAKKYTAKVIRLQTGGKGTARNEGVRLSEGNIIIFVDADIIIPSNALEKVLEDFNNDHKVGVVNGLLSSESPQTNFFSQYKNIYMNYIFHKMPEEIDFLFTSFTAMKKESFIPFGDDLKPKDTKAGQLMAKEKNVLIYLDKSIEVIHLKKHNFISIIKNDFIVPYGWGKLFFEYRGLKDIVKKKRFANASNNQIISLLVSVVSIPFILVSFYAPFFLIVVLSLFLIFGVLNSELFLRIKRKRSNAFLLKAICFTFADQIIMAIGVFSGIISNLFEKMEILK